MTKIEKMVKEISDLRDFYTKIRKAPAPDEPTNRSESRSSRTRHTRRGGDHFMNGLEVVRAKREEIRRTAARHGARNVRVFGSVVRGEATPESDIDFLVATESRTSAWFPAGLILDLEELLDRRVEVVTEKGLNPLIRERVLKEARTL
jgi:predicted nucleotidyltransferase